MAIYCEAPKWNQLFTMKNTALLYCNWNIVNAASKSLIILCTIIADSPYLVKRVNSGIELANIYASEYMHVVPYIYKFFDINLDLSLSYYCSFMECYKIKKVYCNK